MEYQDFLQLAGTTDDIVTEEDFEYIIQPVMEDRRDLFPTDEAVIAYYNIFGLDGFPGLYRAGKIDLDYIRSRVVSFTGYMQHCDGHTTLEHILARLVLAKN